MKWVKRESSLIFADSYSTKQDVIRMLNIPEKKIIVNYPGVRIFIPTPQQIKQTRLKYSLKNDFILSVGKQEPRKNIQRLIRAYAEMPDKKNTDLVIVGPEGWDDEIKKINSSKQKHVHFLHYIGDEELHALYESCTLFAYPSLYEGFGYPVVEAMLHKAPVITSDTSSLKEIGKDAASLFDPHSAITIRQSMERMLNDEKYRKQTAEKGYEKGRLYTWEAYYKKMLDAIYNVLQ